MKTVALAFMLALAATCSAIAVMFAPARWTNYRARATSALIALAREGKESRAAFRPRWRSDSETL